MFVQSQAPDPGTGFWLFFGLIVLAFALIVVIWAAIRVAFGPRSTWREDLSLQQRISEEKRKLEVDAWEESGRRIGGDDGDGAAETTDKDRADGPGGATDDEADRGDADHDRPDESDDPQRGRDR